MGNSKSSRLRGANKVRYKNQQILTLEKMQRTAFKKRKNILSLFFEETTQCRIPAPYMSTADE
jgi:hypothetical protein